MGVAVLAVVALATSQPVVSRNGSNNTVSPTELFPMREEIDYSLLVTGVAAYSTALFLGHTNGLTDVARLALVRGGLSCDPRDSEASLPIELHIFRAEVGEEHRHHVGCILSGVVALVCVGLLTEIAGRLQLHVAPRPRTWLAAVALQPGMMFSATNILAASATVGLKVMAIATLLLMGLLFPLSIWIYALREGTFNAVATAVLPSEGKCCDVWAFVKGPYRWVSHMSHKKFVAAYGWLFRAYAPGFQRLTLWELCGIAAVAFIAGVPSETRPACRVRNALVVAIFVVWCGVIALRQPYGSWFDNAYGVAFSFVVMMAVAVRWMDGSPHAAAWLWLCAVMMALAKVCAAAVIAVARRTDQRAAKMTVSTLDPPKALWLLCPRACFAGKPEEEVSAYRYEDDVSFSLGPGSSPYNSPRLPRSHPPVAASLSPDDLNPLQSPTEVQAHASASASMLSVKPLKVTLRSPGQVGPSREPSEERRTESPAAPPSALILSPHQTGSPAVFLQPCSPAQEPAGAPAEKGTCSTPSGAGIATRGQTLRGRSLSAAEARGRSGSGVALRTPINSVRLPRPSGTTTPLGRDIIPELTLAAAGQPLSERRNFSSPLLDTMGETAPPPAAQQTVPSEYLCSTRSIRSVLGTSVATATAATPVIAAAANPATTKGSPLSPRNLSARPGDGDSYVPPVLPARSPDTPGLNTHRPTLLTAHKGRPLPPPRNVGSQRLRMPDAAPPPRQSPTTPLTHEDIDRELVAERDMLPAPYTPSQPSLLSQQASTAARGLLRGPRQPAPFTPLPRRGNSPSRVSPDLL